MIMIGRRRLIERPILLLQSLSRGRVCSDTLNFKRFINTENGLTEAEYNSLSNEKLACLTDFFENLIEKVDIKGCDVEYSSGVLTVRMGPTGTYVINRQPPNKQIWLSSPLSGPKRYDYDRRRSDWHYAREPLSLSQLLSKEMSLIVKKNIIVP